MFPIQLRSIITNLQKGRLVTAHQWWFNTLQSLGCINPCERNYRPQRVSGMCYIGSPQSFQKTIGCQEDFLQIFDWMYGLSGSVCVPPKKIFAWISLKKNLFWGLRLETMNPRPSWVEVKRLLRMWTAFLHNLAAEHWSGIALLFHESKIPFLRSHLLWKWTVLLVSLCATSLWAVDLRLKLSLSTSSWFGR